VLFASDFDRSAKALLRLRSIRCVAREQQLAFQPMHLGMNSRAPDLSMIGKASSMVRIASSN
jgi:hypothetical protein